MYQLLKDLCKVMFMRRLRVIQSRLALAANERGALSKGGKGCHFTMSMIDVSAGASSRAQTEPLLNMWRQAGSGSGLTRQGHCDKMLNNSSKSCGAVGQTHVDKEESCCCCRGSFEFKNGKKYVVNDSKINKEKIMLSFFYIKDLWGWYHLIFQNSCIITPARSPRSINQLLSNVLKSRLKTKSVRAFLWWPPLCLNP